MPWVIDIVLNFFKRTDKDYAPISNLTWFVNTIDVKERDLLATRLRNFGCLTIEDKHVFSPCGQFKAIKPETAGRVTIV